MNEIELKLLVDKPTAKRLHARAKALEPVGSTAKTRTLRTIYLDTPDHSLKNAGIALRLRHDRHRWIQSVKAERTLNGGLSRAGEVENPAPGGKVSTASIPDPEIRDKVQQCVNGSPLQPICETVIRRTAVELVSQSGTRAELAIDIGEIRAGGRAMAISEAEIELVDGNPRSLYDIAQTLLPDGGWRFSRLSKGARGYLLAEEGRIEPELLPRKAEVVPLEPATAVGDAARDILRECFNQIATNIAVVDAMDDPEGPHQLRIGLRRLRSAIAVFSTALDDPEFSRLNDEAKRLGRKVGLLRDIEVLRDEIVRREADAFPEETAFAMLSERLAAEAAQTRKKLRVTLRNERVQAFLFDLARVIETGGWLRPQDSGQIERLARPIAEIAGSAVNRRWAKVVARTDELDTLKSAERHELRKELKKLRYVAEFFSPLYPHKQVAPFVKQLKKLQSIFGKLNDAAMVRAKFTSDVGKHSDAAIERAIGWVTGASQVHAEIAWSQAKARWRQLEKSKLYWK